MSLESLTSQKKWDEYYLRIAREVATNSKCHSRKIGAVLVKHKSIVSTGYNGPPMGMRPCDVRWVEDGLYEPLIGAIGAEAAASQCPRRVLGYKSGKGLDVCVAAHAERNALLQAAKLGIATYGTTLYCWCGQICKDCAIEIVNAGVAELVYLDGEPPYDSLAGAILEESGVLVRTVSLGGD